jgi:ribosomal protein S18 acetylase RimI-like enzyme
MIAHDWRSSSATDVAPLYAAEVASWMSTLHWDTRASWTIVEAVRAAGSLPGFIVRDAQGAIRGWTFYLRHEGALQVGAFTADSPEASATLLDAITSSSHAASASAIVFFTFSTAPGLAVLLEARGFAVEQYRYLQSGLKAQAGLKACTTSGDPDAASGGQGVQAFRPADVVVVAGLLASAYPSHDPARPFARSGQPHEWVDYVSRLVTTSGCGLFLPGASFVAPGESPARADAVTLMTRLSRDTVHLAQIAVSPAARGRGLARRLIAASLAAAAAAGHARATLLVGEHNLAARHLYDRLGFADVAMFVSAVRDQPRRSTSAALETGGAITLR